MRQGRGRICAQDLKEVILLLHSEPNQIMGLFLITFDTGNGGYHLIMHVPPEATSDGYAASGVSCAEVEKS